MITLWAFTGCHIPWAGQCGNNLRYNHQKSLTFWGIGIGTDPDMRKADSGVQTIFEKKNAGFKSRSDKSLKNFDIFEHS
jgi:hypothetical protein